MLRHKPVFFKLSLLGSEGRLSSRNAWRERGHMGPPPLAMKDAYDLF
jgi:hypothetical protein